MQTVLSLNEGLVLRNKTHPSYVRGARKAAGLSRWSNFRNGSKRPLAFDPRK